MSSSVDDILFSPITAEPPKSNSSKSPVPEILDRLRPWINLRLSCYFASMNTGAVREVIRVDIANFLRPFLAGGSGNIQYQVVCDQTNNTGGIFSKIEVWVMVDMLMNDTLTKHDIFWMKFQV